MQPRKPVPRSRSQIDDLRPLDQAARLQVDPLLAVFQGQLDPVADQRLARHQLVVRSALGGAEGGDQPDARDIAPDQNR